MNKENQYGHVALIYGGVSAEREVSLRSGKAVGDALTRLGVMHTVIDASGKDLVQALLSQSYDRAFIVLHGGDGEDGHVQALLEILNIPHTGSKMLANAIGMDKILTKNLWQANGLPTPKSIELTADLNIQDLRMPLAVKPSTQGSSVGISKVKNADQLVEAYHLAAQYGVVMAEEWITGVELTVAVMGDEVFPSVRIQPNNEYYDYDAKYISGSNYFCPSGLSDDQENTIQVIAKKAYDILGCGGCARMDFIQCQQTQDFFLIEANTVPGMTELSLVPKAAAAKGWSFDTLVEKMLEQTL